MCKAYLQIGMDSKLSISIRSGGVKQIALLMALIIVTFRPFDFLPGMSAVRQAWIVFVFLFTLTIYPMWIVRKHWKLSAFELYTIFLIVSIPILSAISARNEFGQSLTYGLLAQRGIVLCATSLILIFAFKHRFFELLQVEKSMLILGWTSLIIFSLFSAVVDPKLFSGAQFVAGGNTGEEAFMFNAYLIIFCFFYYFYKGYRLHSGRSYLYAMLFFVFLVIIDGGRAMLLSLLATLLYFSVKWGSWSKLIRMFPKILISGFVLLTLLYLTNGQYITKLVDKFGDAFAVVTSGAKGEDSSANARIVETLIALPYIEKHWFAGNGDISNQWQGGYMGVLGGYFFPSDIGMIGVVYMYGVLGALFFLLQFFFAIKFDRKLISNVNPFINAVTAFLVYFAMHSIVNGRFVHMAEISFFMVAILAVASMKYRRNKGVNVTCSMLDPKAGYRIIDTK